MMNQGGWSFCFNRLFFSYFKAGDHANPVKSVEFTYDKPGNLTSYDDSVTSAEYEYDEAYRKIAETVDYSPF